MDPPRRPLAESRRYGPEFIELAQTQAQADRKQRHKQRDFDDCAAGHRGPAPDRWGGSPRAAKTGPSGDATRRRGRESVAESPLAWCAEGARRPTDEQIEVPPDDPTTQVTPARDSTPAQCDRSRLSVRAKAGNLRAVAARQVLGFEACQSNHVRIHVDRRHCYGVLTITFAAVSPDTLAAMVRRLTALPWALDAYFYS